MKRIVQKKFEGKVKLSAKAKAVIQWWINNIDNSCHHINISNPDITIILMQVLQLDTTNGISPSRGLWQKAELEDINEVLGWKQSKQESKHTWQSYGVTVSQL